MKETIDPDQFFATDIRIGTVVSSTLNAGARKPAMMLHIDFGNELGVLKSSAQITSHYAPEDLVGRQVAAVVNLPARQIGTMQSRCLVLGAVEPDGGVVLLAPDRLVENGIQVA